MRLDVAVDAAAGVIHFAVYNTGIGIAADDLAQLFQPFKQLDSSLSRQHGGTGPGLALVRRLRSIPTYAQVPIITLAALAMPGDRERCLAAGANADLDKPVSLRGLVEMMGALLDR